MNGSAFDKIVSDTVGGKTPAAPAGAPTGDFDSIVAGTLNGSVKAAPVAKIGPSEDPFADIVTQTIKGDLPAPSGGPIGLASPMRGADTFSGAVTPLRPGQAIQPAIVTPPGITSIPNAGTLTNKSSVGTGSLDITAKIQAQEKYLQKLELTGDQNSPQYRQGRIDLSNMYQQAGKSPTGQPLGNSGSNALDLALSGGANQGTGLAGTGTPNKPVAPVVTLGKGGIHAPASAWSDANARKLSELPFTLADYQDAINKGLSVVKDKNGQSYPMLLAARAVQSLAPDMNKASQTPQEVEDAASQERANPPAFGGAYKPPLWEQPGALAQDFASKYQKATGLTQDDAPYAYSALHFLGGMTEGGIKFAQNPVQGAADMGGHLDDLLTSVNFLDPNIDGPTRFERVLNAIVTADIGRNLAHHVAAGVDAVAGGPQFTVPDSGMSIATALDAVHNYTNSKEMIRAADDLGVPRDKALQIASDYAKRLHGEANLPTPVRIINGFPAIAEEIAKRSADMKPAPEETPAAAPVPTEPPAEAAAPVEEPPKAPAATGSENPAPQFATPDTEQHLAEVQATLPPDISRQLDELGAAMAKTRAWQPQQIAGVKVAVANVLRLGHESGKPLSMVEALGSIDPSGKLAQEIAAPFYSKLEQVVTDKVPNNAPPDQIRNTLIGAGVKPEEMQWTGTDKFLADAQGPVAKQDLLDHLSENQVRVNEIVKGTRGLSPAESDELESLRNKVDGDPEIQRLTQRQNALAQAFADNPNDSTRATWDKAQDALTAELNKRFSTEQQRIAELSLIEQPLRSADTKFSQYALPGGSNYREMLLQLPPKAETAHYQVGGYMPKGGFATREAAQAYIDDWQNRIAEMRKDPQFAPVVKKFEETPFFINEYRTPASGTYTQGHWGEPNVLAHIRFDDRTGPNGEKILHVAEIQSDWHQTGRKNGYHTGKYEVFDPRDGKTITQFDTEAEAKAYVADKPNLDYSTPETNAHQGSVPDAPFKKTWHELALKRIMRYAAENGYDKVTWDTGDTNADRYDLSKQVKSINYRDHGDGTVTLEADLLNGGQHNFGRIPGDKLSDYVGKEVAQKIANGEGYTPSGYDEPGWKGLKGVDLKVGGEGMKGFYDKILPDAANKIGKRFGAKVEATEVPQGHDVGRNQRGIYEGPIPTEAEIKSLRDSRSELSYISTNAREMLEAAQRGEISFHNADSIRDWLGNQGAPGFAERLGGTHTIVTDKTTAPAHGIGITPEMRKSLVNEGQPLFQTKMVKRQGRWGRPAQYEVRGAYDPATRVIQLATGKADVSTALHEIAHYFHDVLLDHPEWGATIRKAYGDLTNTKGAEQFARHFESYFYDGRSPVKAMQPIFEAIKGWMRDIYSKFARKDQVPANVRDIFDKVVGADHPETQALIKEFHDAVADDRGRVTGENFNPLEHADVNDPRLNPKAPEYDPAYDGAVQHALGSQDFSPGAGRDMIGQHQYERSFDTQGSESLRDMLDHLRGTGGEKPSGPKYNGPRSKSLPKVQTFYRRNGRMVPGWPNDVRFTDLSNYPEDVARSLYQYALDNANDERYYADSQAYADREKLGRKPGFLTESEYIQREMGGSANADNSGELRGQVPQRLVNQYADQIARELSEREKVDHAKLLGLTNEEYADITNWYHAEHESGAAAYNPFLDTEDSQIESAGQAPDAHAIPDNREPGNQGAGRPSGADNFTLSAPEAKPTQTSLVDVPKNDLPPEEQRQKQKVEGPAQPSMESEMAGQGNLDLEPVSHIKRLSDAEYEAMMARREGGNRSLGSKQRGAVGIGSQDWIDLVNAAIYHLGKGVDKIADLFGRLHEAFPDASSAEISEAIRQGQEAHAKIAAGEPEGPVTGLARKFENPERAARGQEPLPTMPTTKQGLLDLAKSEYSKFKADPATGMNPDDILNKANSGGRVSPTENVVMQLYKNDVMNERRRLDANEPPKGGEAYSRWLDKSLANENDLNTISGYAQAIGGYWHQLGLSHGIGLDPRATLVETNLRAVEKSKGSPLSAKEKGEVTRLANELQNANETIERLREQNAREKSTRDELVAKARAEAGLRRAALDERMKTRAATAEGARALRKDAWQRLAKAGAQMNFGADISKAPEAAKAVRDIAVSYFHEGVTDLASIVDKVVTEAKIIGLELTPRHVLDALGGDTTATPRMLSDADQQVRALKAQARAQAKLEDIEAGNEPSKRTGPVGPDSPELAKAKEDLAALQKKLREAQAQAKADADLERAREGRAKPKVERSKPSENVQRTRMMAKIQDSINEKQAQIAKMQETGAPIPPKGKAPSLDPDMEMRQALNQRKIAQKQLDDMREIVRPKTFGEKYAAPYLRQNVISGLGIFGKIFSTILSRPIVTPFERAVAGLAGKIRMPDGRLLGDTSLDAEGKPQLGHMPMYGGGFKGWKDFMGGYTRSMFGIEPDAPLNIAKGLDYYRKNGSPFKQDAWWNQTKDTFRTNGSLVDKWGKGAGAAGEDFNPNLSIDKWDKALSVAGRLHLAGKGIPSIWAFDAYADAMREVYARAGYDTMDPLVSEDILQRAATEAMPESFKESSRVASYLSGKTREALKGDALDQTMGIFGTMLAPVTRIGLLWTGRALRLSGVAPFEVAARYAKMASDVRSFDRTMRDAVDPATGEKYTPDKIAALRSQVITPKQAELFMGAVKKTGVMAALMGLAFASPNAIRVKGDDSKLDEVDPLDDDEISVFGHKVEAGVKGMNFAHALMHLPEVLAFRTFANMARARAAAGLPPMDGGEAGNPNVAALKAYGSSVKDTVGTQASQIPGVGSVYWAGRQSVMSGVPSAIGTATLPFYPLEGLASNVAKMQDEPGRKVPLVLPDNQHANLHGEPLNFLAPWINTTPQIPQEIGGVRMPWDTPHEILGLPASRLDMIKSEGHNRGRKSSR